MHVGWNTLTFSLAEMSKTGAPTDTITTIQLRLEPKTGETTEIYFDAIELVQANRGNVVFTMDDGWTTQYTVAYPILKKYGIRGTIALISNKVGQENTMSLEQFTEVYVNGWDLVNHTHTHTRLAEKTRAEQYAEISTCQQYLLSNGFNRGAYDMIYPYGSYNDDTISVLEELGIRSGRSVVDWYDETPPERRYAIRCINLTDTVTVQRAINAIEAAIATGGTIFFLNHRYGLDADPLFYPADRYDQIAAYVARNRSRLNVLTMSEYTRQFIGG
jgi:peptidoglycan/xylan/chitin deacetylase (PgdA/CDA1 family)